MSTVETAKPTDRRYAPRAALDHIAAAWAIVESNFRGDGERADVRVNRARAVGHLEAAIAVIRGEVQP
jgi:hypothetical protein